MKKHWHKFYSNLLAYWLKEIGPTPKNMNEFLHNTLFDRNFQEKNDMNIMDSNYLKRDQKKK